MTTRGLRNKLTNRSQLAARRAEDEQTQTRRSRRARRAQDEEPVAEGDEDLAEGEDDNLVEEETTTTTTRKSRRGAKRARRAQDEEPVAEDDEFAEGEEDYAEDDEPLAEGEDDLAEGEEDFAEGEDDLAEGEDDEFAEGEPDGDELAEGEDDPLAEEEDIPAARRSKRAKRGARKGARATGERGRIAAIMNSKYATGRGRLAQFLALSTSVSPRLAINILARAGKSTAAGTAPARGNSARGDAFRRAMGTVPNPRISSGRSAQRSEADDVFTGLAAMGQQMGLMPSQKKDR